MRTCSLCGKKTVILRRRSHAQNQTPRAYRANIQKVTIKVGKDKISGFFCTKCLKRMKKELNLQQKTASSQK
ncbi:MAG TPA: L28 family ribosomal protein [Candidatus Woesebacteria bacterium]|nr:L28 family ribosomal protein [Candidatus Woesebacteria bacterium]HRT40303.1 L28 family ribosomal protein [Candidatus Woesebacteria bacterium]